MNVVNFLCAPVGLKDWKTWFCVVLGFVLGALTAYLLR